MIMKTRKTVLNELLFYLCDLCEENDIEYSLVGEPAATVLYGGRLPSQYNRLVVVMPVGQIRKLMSAVDGGPDGRYGLMYFANTPNALDFTFRLTDNGFRIIDIDNYESRGDYPAAITIYELEKPAPSERKRFKNILRYVNGQSWSISDPANYLRMLKWRSKQIIRGRERFLEDLLKNREKVLGIYDWAAACREHTVMFGDNELMGESLDDVKTIDIQGHMIRVATTLTDPECVGSSYGSLGHHGRYEMDLGYIPEGFLDRKEIRDQLSAIIRQEKDYIRTRQSTAKENEVIRKAQLTYEMTAKVKSFEEDYDDDRISEISGYLDDKDLKSAEKALKPYIDARKKFRSMHIPFIENEKVEPVLKRFFEINGSSLYSN